jgi:hypothetical protein
VTNGPSRGRITFSTGCRPKIELFDSADASTLINLTAHEWLEKLIEDADDPQAPHNLKADVLAVLRWLGVEKTKDIKTPDHDKFARGAETYMMEGRAPSRELAPIFEKQREWLINIYGNQSLNAPLDDEIRGVFDRLLATPEQIADWQAARK